jgi:ERCC4-type nuclease
MTENNQIELVIDMRERELELELDKTKSIRFKVEQLDLGDIVFRKGTDVILIIERKTVNDLKASICDGRGREQKARLLNSGIQRDRVMYLIEGNLDKSLDSKVSGLPVSTLVGSLINTQLRDNIKVYKTASMRETGEFIIKLLDKLNKDGDDYFREGEQKISASEYSATLKKKKKANMTAEVWFISQLALIPQVTEKISEVIVKKYKNVMVLLEEYNKTPEHLKAKLLSDLKYSITNGKERRIGDKISERIYKFFHGIVEEEQNNE